MRSASSRRQPPRTGNAAWRTERLMSRVIDRNLAARSGSQRIVIGETRRKLPQDARRALNLAPAATRRNAVGSASATGKHGRASQAAHEWRISREIVAKVPFAGLAFPNEC